MTRAPKASVLAPVLAWSLTTISLLMVGLTLELLGALTVTKRKGESLAVRLGEHDGALTFAIEDDGRRFDPAGTPRGSGLTNMADRLDALGGRVDLHSEPGAGTKLNGVPIEQAVPA